MLVCSDSHSRFMVVYGLRCKVTTLDMVNVSPRISAPWVLLRASARTTVGGFHIPRWLRSATNVKNRHEYTATDTQEQNGVAKSAIWGVMKAGQAARLEAPRLFAGTGFTAIPSLLRNLNRQRMEATAWAADGNRSAATANQKNNVTVRGVHGNRRQSTLCRDSNPYTREPSLQGR